MENIRRCPVCGSETENVPCEICKVCDWESDWFQEQYPDEDAGPNRLTLNEARAAWATKQSLPQGSVDYYK